MKPIIYFKDYLKHKGISYKKADEDLKLSKSYISKQINSEASIGTEILTRILSTYFDLNPVWLLSGHGEMLLDDTKATDNMVNQHNRKIIANQEKMLELNKVQIQILQEKIDALQTQLSLYQTSEKKKK
jgi:plasmid maintenance system antidote protein VapI